MPDGPEGRDDPDGPLSSGRSRTRLIVLIGALVLAIAAVAVALVLRRGNDAPPVVAVPPTTTSSTTSTVPTATAPLTGLQVDPAVIARPALVVKIDNAEGLARPQAGVNEADVVIEEKVEGNISRFFAVFHSTDAASIGPVRSARSTDISLVGEFRTPLFGYSGANDTFLGLLASAPLVDVGYNRLPGAYARLAERRAPHNLFTATALLWAATPEGAQPPGSLGSFASGARPPAGALPAGSIGFGFGSGGAPVEYRWDGAAGSWGRWQNGTPHVDADGVQITPANVIVQFVPYGNSGARDSNGNPVPEADTLGTGEALVVLDGIVVRGTWHRGSSDEMTRFTDASGQSIALRPGRTWIALVPAGTAVAIA